MGSAMQAANDLKSLANKFKAIVDIAEALEEIGSLEAAAFAAKGRQEDAYRDEQIAKLAKQDKELELQNIQEQVELAKKEAIEVDKRAQKMAQDAIAAARSQAERIIAEAQQKKTAIENEVGGHKLGLKQIQAEVEAKSQELLEIKKKIAETKAKISELVS